MEPMDIVGKSKEDVTLPKATMFKIIKEMLPPDVRVARDAQDLIVECCVEFINLVSSESNEVCNREDKRTIAPEHVLKALEVLGFGEYIEEVYAAYEQHRLETLDSPKGGRFSGAEMTEEEAAAEQQRMFAEARARMNNGMNVQQKQLDTEHTSDAAEQQRLLADAHARINNGSNVQQKQLDAEHTSDAAEPQGTVTEAGATSNDGLNVQEKQLDAEHTSESL